MSETPSPGGVAPLQTPLERISHEPALTRSNSRSKGINLNTVSPVLASKATFKRSQLSNLSNSYTHNIRASTRPQLSSDKPLLDPEKTRPHTNESTDTTNISSRQLAKLTIDEQLRLLALKEMSLVELKDTIATLNHRLHLSEKELQRFRQTIQRNLFREMEVSAVHTRKPKKDKMEPVVANGAVNSAHRRSRSRSSTRKQQPKVHHYAESTLPQKQLQDIDFANSPSEPPSIDHDDESSSLWSNISKPIAFIQNLEGMIQSEMERNIVHKSDESFRSPRQFHQSSGNQAWTHDGEGAVASSYSHAGSFETLREALTESIPFKDPEIMLQSVSNSLWSFVNEVKQNVLAPNMSPENAAKTDVESISESEEEILGDSSLPSVVRRTRPRK